MSIKEVCEEALCVTDHLLEQFSEFLEYEDVHTFSIQYKSWNSVSVLNPIPYSIFCPHVPLEGMDPTFEVTGLYFTLYFVF